MCFPLKSRLSSTTASQGAHRCIPLWTKFSDHRDICIATKKQITVRCNHDRSQFARQSVSFLLHQRQNSLSTTAVSFVVDMRACLKRVRAFNPGPSSFVMSAAGGIECHSLTTAAAAFGTPPLRLLLLLPLLLLPLRVTKKLPLPLPPPPPPRRLLLLLLLLVLLPPPAPAPVPAAAAATATDTATSSTLATSCYGYRCHSLPRSSSSSSSSSGSISSSGSGIAATSPVATVAVLMMLRG